MGDAERRPAAGKGCARPLSEGRLLARFSFTLSAVLDEGSDVCR
jgi:hypothetical protein